MTMMMMMMMTADTRNKILYNKYLHDASDNDMCSAISLAELSSVCNGLMDCQIFVFPMVCDLILYFVSP